MGRLAQLAGVARCTLSGSLAAVIALMALGCGPGAARTPNPTRSLDERRAIQVIQRAVAAEGARPAPGRDVVLATGKTIHLDVGIQGHAYGIAYLTQEDRDQAGDAIPPPNQRDERLRLARAGTDGEVRLVLLYQTNYVFDDLVGEDREQTSVTAERALSRDVQDFVTHARTQKFK
jgi:hypothetical protein